MSHRDHTRLFGAWRYATVLATVVAAMLLAPSCWAATPASTSGITHGALDPTISFGINTGVMFNSEQYSRAQVDSQLASLAATGSTVVRSDALWEYTETQPPLEPFRVHRYNWTLDDEIVTSLAEHGLHWLPIIDYSPQWARAVPSDLHSPPASASDYAAFAAALASRYGPGGNFWLEYPNIKQVPVLTYEIWNEPDNGVFWQPTPNPAAYATLYTAARNAIKSKEAGATVLVGGLTRPAWFLQALTASDPAIAGQIDGVAIHPYGSTPARVFSAVRAARLAMRSYGLAAVPLYITEFGWTTHGPGGFSTTAAQRPEYISTTVSTLGHTDCGIASVLLYAWTTPERNASNPQDWYGISPPGGGSSADIVAFTSALTAAKAPAAPVLLCSANPPLQLLGALPIKVPKPDHRRHHPRRPKKRAKCTRSRAKHRKCKAPAKRR
jgi:hypothetical protein